MTNLDQKVRGVRMYLAERAKMRQIDFDQIHGLHVGDAREAVLKATDLTAILDEYDRRGAALVEAAKAIEALQADNERLRAALQKARPYVADLPIVGDADLAAIDAALTTKGEADD